MPPFFTTKKIKPPKSLGEILKKRRKKLALSLFEAEKETKIKRIYLNALEANDWDQLPSEVYVFGFLNTYAKTLKLDAKKIVKHFKKDILVHKNVHKKAIENPQELKVRRVYLTPKMVISVVVAMIIFALGTYLWTQVSGFATAPELRIIEPNAVEVKTLESKIKIAGETESDSSLTLNSQPVPVDINGRFEQEVTLQKGVNTFEIIATNNAGKKTIKLVQVMSQ